SRRESRRFRRAYGAFLEAHGVTGGAASYARAGELALRFLDDRGHVDPLPTEMESKEAADGDPDR
ncbi:MAG: hypothetical protein OEQ13_14025, partial [Acidobacteriota bacterium]|nr:hypothetical protein [Acidobacteriota bacterium]